MLQYAKVFLKGIIVFISHLVALTLVGTIVNWIYLIINLRIFATNYNTYKDSFWNIFSSYKPVIMIVLFFVVFPILWLIIGKINGTYRALFLIYNKIKTPLNEFLSNALSKIVGDQRLSNLSKSKQAKFIRNKIEQMEKLPFGLRLILPLIIALLPLEKIIELCKNTGTDADDFKESIIDIISSSIQDRLSTPWFFTVGLCVINISALVLCWIFLI